MSKFLADLSEEDFHNPNTGSALEYRQSNRIQNMSNSNIEKEYGSRHWKNGEMEKIILF